MSDAPIVLNADQVSELIPRINLAKELREMFAELGNNQAVQPSQTVTLFPEDRGDYITYLAAQANAGVFGAKLSPYLVTEGKPIITAWTMLMSMETGLPLLLCDSGQLTTERTAGTTALAVDFLAQPGAKTLAIIGTGGVALAHYRHTKDLRNWSDVRVYSPGLETDNDRKAAWKALNPEVVFSDSAESAAADADVVMLCTSSGKPVVDVAALKNSALVTSISTNVAQAHEVDPAWLASAQVYCDYRATTPASAGEMVLAAAEHGWNTDSIRGDLAELATGNAPLPDAQAPTFFRSIGLGLEDIAAANAVLRLLQSE